MRRVVLAMACAALTALVISACTGPVGLKNVPQAQAGSVRVNHGALAGGSSSASLPGFFLFEETRNHNKFAHTVVEYAMNATQSAKPLRRVQVPGIFFGADKKGELYSRSIGPEGSFYCTVCQVFVQSVTGQPLSTFTLPEQPGNGASPDTFFVDPAGSVYDITGYCRIQQFAPGSSGTNVKPIRTINIPEIACKGPYPPIDRFQLFADAKGNVYYHGFNGVGIPDGEATALYIWGPGAHGATPPARIITGQTYNESAGNGAVQGVDSKGNIWVMSTYNPPVAYEYPPSAHGVAKPIVVPLQGFPGITSLVVSQNDRLVYLGYTSVSRWERFIGSAIAVSLPGAAPTQTINIPKVYEFQLFTAL